MILPAWSGPVVVVASGPSLTQADVEYCRDRAGVVVVNDCWRLAPWADALYAADRAWWEFHLPSIDFAGEKWCGTQWARGRDEIEYVAVEGTMKRGFAFDGTTLRRGGGNSGFQAVNLAILRGANPIYMLGFDMQMTGGRKHWFGNHPSRLDRHQNFDRWVREMDFAAAGAAELGIRIVNCSRETALRAYARAEIRDVV